jgi:hypothetical protein
VLKRFFETLPDHAKWLLPVFCVCLVALNVWRLEDWGPEGFRVWFTHTIMQTTLFDFGWVLLVLSYFIHMDAKKHGLSWWWVVPTYPFMPTIGLLAYFIVRQNKRRASEANELRLRGEAAQEDAS